MITPEQVVAIKVWLYWVALVAVILRLYVRFRQRTFTASEGFIIISIILYTAEEGINIALWKNNFFNLPMQDFSIGGFPSLENHMTTKEKVSEILALYFWSSTITFWTFWATKGAFLVMYYQLVPKSLKWLRRALHATTFIVIATFAGFVATSMFGCGDIRRNWSPDPKTLCFSFDMKSSVLYLAITHLGTDIMIYILPFFLLPHLQLPLRQRLGIAAMFALGIAVIGCILARCCTVWVAGGISMREMMTWDSGEMTLGILVACSPCFKWLWQYAKRHREESLEATGSTGRKSKWWWSSSSSGGVISLVERPSSAYRRDSRLLIKVKRTVEVEGFGDSIIDKEEEGKRGREGSQSSSSRGILVEETSRRNSPEIENERSWLDDQSMLTTRASDQRSMVGNSSGSTKKPIPAYLRV